MQSPEVGRGAPLPSTASVTKDVFRTDATGPSQHSVSSSSVSSSSAPASAERDPNPASSPPLEGSIKQYEVIRKIGEGGIGIVLLARDTKLGRLVAIKLLQGSGRTASHLLAEARATARCKHDNIVDIYEIAETDGYPYMVLEYLEGRTLRDVLSSGPGGSRRALPIGLALDIVTSVLRALAAAHESDVVHRDLKPENIMILDSGQVKVLDFGMASRSDPTAPGTRGGTRAYMAPEQWLDEDIDVRTDLWAAGVVLYELLAGAHPLAPVTRERLESVTDLDAPMPRLRDIRPELAALSDIVERCLCKRKKERFESAGALLSALDPLREGAKPVALAEGELPFTGLSAFQESDAGRFFGRERNIAAVVGRLRRQRLVTVAGPSGAGKSSFLRAGVIPALKRSGENWDVLVLRPGRAPLSALGEALEEALGTGTSPIVDEEFHAEPGLLGTRLRAHCRAHGRRALVFVDQFEELYTLVSDPGERTAFIKSLLGAADEASSPLRVVLAIRSDFLDRIADDGHLMAEVTSGLFLLPPVGREGLREALLRPVEAAGYRFEDEAMVTDILDELARAKTPLPLLQFSAAELWETRDRERKVLTRASYEALGGVAGALSTHADAVFAALSPSDQRLCQAILLRLVTPERTRAIVSMPELASLAEDPAAAAALVQHLCGARLLLLETGGEAGAVTVEMVHESLIERWPRLARWLAESTADAQFLARLRAAASQWQAGGDAPGLLWRDRAAEEARAWYERRRADPDSARGLQLGRAEERYLLAVIALFERARRRRKRSIAGAFALLSAVSVLVFFLAMRAQNNAKRADAEALRVKEQNGELAFQALRGRNAVRMLAARKRQDDPTLMLALLREVEPGDIPHEWAELVSGALSSGVARDELSGIHGGQPVYEAVISPDGTRMATVSEDKTAQIWTFGDYRKLALLRGHDAYLSTVAWSPDGKRVVTASGDCTARIWNADGSGEPLVLRGHEDDVNTAVMSADGERVLTASGDGTARVWSAKDGRPLVLLRHDGPVDAAAFDPDGQQIVTSSAGGILRVWDAGGKGAPRLLRGHTDMVTDVAWSPDGKRIASGSKDTTVRVWDATTGKTLFVLRGHEDKVISVVWSSDGTRIASASRDKTARVWSANGTGYPIVLRGHKHWIYTANFSPDGRYLLTTSLDRTLRAWELDEIAAPTVLVGHADVVNDAQFSPDGARIVTASQDRTARVWNADGTGSPVVLRGHTEPVETASWSPDGARIITLSTDKTARIWSADGASSPVVLTGHQAEVYDVDWSLSGDRIVTASTDGVLRSWTRDGSRDGWKLEAETRIRIAPSSRVHVHLNREGKRVSWTDSAGTIYLWNAAEGGDPALLDHHDAPTTDTVPWSPDGSRLASGSDDGTAQIWDVRGGAAPIVLRGHEGGVIMVSWSPDGKRIVTTSTDMTARIWNADGSGQPLVLRGHGEKVTWASYSPDGARIATASADTTVRVWNADGSGEPFVLGGSLLACARVIWSPDGKHILTRTEEKVVRVWRDVQPFSGPGDARLWRATSYCIPASLRVDLLHVTEAEARANQEQCERHVTAARAAAAGGGGTPSP